MIALHSDVNLWCTSDVGAIGALYSKALSLVPHCGSEVRCVLWPAARASERVVDDMLCLMLRCAEEKIPSVR